MKGVVIAAGRGGRLSGLGEPKPLVMLRGRPLLSHVIDRSMQAGLEEIIVVSGYRHTELEAFVEGQGRASVRCIHNPRWETGQHTSVCAVADVMDTPFILMMSDHLFDPTIVADLIAGTASPADLTLAVDRNLDNPLVDLDDVTRVVCDGGRLVRVGKHLKEYNAFDTGLFRCTPSLFEALRQAAASTPALSDGVQALADAGNAAILDITGRFWIDVDDERMHALASAAIASGN